MIGWRHEIEKLDREDALAFYQRFYTPNNAVLVVAGDVTADEVRTLAEETYGKVAKRRRDRAAPAAAGAGAGRRASRHAGRSARQAAEPAPRLSVPSSATAKAGESEALEVLSHILGRGTTSRLYPTWWSSANSRSAPAAGTTAPRSMPRSSASTARRSRASRLPQLESAIDAVIDDVVAKGVTADEVERAKNRLIADAIYAQDSQATMARWYGAALDHRNRPSRRCRAGPIACAR